MKKLLMIFTMLMAASVFADTWTDPATGIEWTYTVKNGEATVGKNYLRAVSDSTTGAIVIPSTLGGCPVTSIGEYAFQACTGLTSVTIPPSVISVGRDAFSHCSGLGEILVAAGNDHYASMDGVLFNKSKTEIVAYPGGKCGHYAIPLGVTSIGDRAFFACSGLTSVTILPSVTSVGEYAFQACTGLTSVIIPSSVISIGRGAFSICDRLASIDVEKNNAHYSSQGGVLFNKSKTELTGFPGGKSGAYVIPSSVTIIGDDAIRNCYGLTSITIPSSVTSIGELAFFYCSGLTSVTIPSSVMSIGHCAFGSCTGLTSITIPSSVKSIDWGAFSCCTSLTNVTIPSSVTSIGKEAFSGCSSLTGVTIPSSVTSIGRWAFSGCEALKTVYVAKGDTHRVKKMLEESHDEYGRFYISRVTFVEDLDPTPGPTPTPTPEPEPEPEEEEAFEEKHTFNGLVTDEYGMCGMIQVATAKKSAKGEVKVSGFVMLEDGKKQSIKAVSGKVSGGAVEVATKVGKTSLSLTITDDGFTGTLGEMAVASADIGEETGIISGTLKMSYFDAKTGKVKTKSIKISGLASGSIAEGTLTVGKEEPKSFAAEIE